jgi:hypothetical protein
VAIAEGRRSECDQRSDAVSAPIPTSEPCCGERTYVLVVHVGADPPLFVERDGGAQPEQPALTAAARRGEDADVGDHRRTIGPDRKYAPPDRYLGYIIL